MERLNNWITRKDTLKIVSQKYYHENCTTGFSYRHRYNCEHMYYRGCSGGSSTPHNESPPLVSCSPAQAFCPPSTPHFGRRPQVARSIVHICSSAQARVRIIQLFSGLVFGFPSGRRSNFYSCPLNLDRGVAKFNFHSVSLAASILWIGNSLSRAQLWMQFSMFYHMHYGNCVIGIARQ